ncbi:MAG TPA: TonB-dependent receptor, partial [Candidatus Methylacidiphilales bacterium]
TTDHIEILRGVNGFNDGPLSLGGVINYVTKTGYDSAPAQVRVEGGSYGYLHEQVSSGLVDGDFDYYLSLTHFEQSGYRNFTSGNSSRAVFDFGYKITPDLTTRFKAIYVDQHQDDAGYLTWAQFQANPKQSQFPQIRVRDNPGTFLISNQTDFKIDGDSSIDNGVQYNNYPINGLGGPAQTTFLFGDISDTLRYQRKDLLFDHQSNTTVSLLAYKQLNSEFDSYDVNWKLTGRRPADQGDYTLVESNDFEIIPHLWLTTALAEIYQTRETNIDFSSNPLTTRSRINRDYFNVDPRVGVHYDFNDKDQIFANVSRSVDTPSSNSYVRTDANQAPLGIIDLKPAEATTVEIGARGESGPFKWSADFYNSWVDNELLTVPVAPGSPAPISSNATPTIHQGVEAELDTTLWQEEAVPFQQVQGAGDPKDIQSPGNPIEESPQRLVLRQVYTWNNFYYAGDPQFGQNTLAGVPVHVYQAELEYDHPSGFYIGVNVESVLTKYAVDFANSFYTQPYAILGAKAGFADEKHGWEVFVEGRNLPDENYVAAVAPSFTGGQTAAALAPGQGRGV